MKFWAISLSILLASCASGDFSSGGGSKANPSSTASGNPNESNNANNTNQNNNLGTTTSSSFEVLDNGRVKETFEGELTVMSLVDIVFAVDTSGSMLTEKSYLETNMKQFLDQFIAGSKNIDFHIYMIGSNFNFPDMNHEKITLIKQSVSSRDSLSILRKFFNGEISNPKPLRAESKKQIVVITDDNASGVKAVDFKNFINSTPSLAGKTTFNGFVGLTNSAQNSWCRLASVGSEYVQLGSDPQVGGFIQDLCIENWSLLLKNLASKIITGIAKLEFSLKKAVNNTLIEVTVGGIKLPTTAFTFNAEKNSIVISTEFAPKDRESVAITYQAK